MFGCHYQLNCELIFLIVVDVNKCCENKVWFKGFFYLLITLMRMEITEYFSKGKL